MRANVFQDLLSAVEKFNSVLCTKKETNGSYYFRADEMPTLGLGTYDISSYSERKRRVA